MHRAFDTLFVVAAPQVAGNGYVFGAYTHCSWPKESGSPHDPSNQSFLFSLVHKVGQAPVRFSQCDSTPGAVGLGSDGPNFGNFILMRGGSSASASDGNSSYSLGCVTQTSGIAYQPDDASQCDASFNFAGSMTFAFACEEIEVYETDGSDRKETGAAAVNGLKRPLDGSSSSSAASPDSSAYKRQKMDK